MKEDPKKVAERVRRYREHTTTERLEIIGLEPALKERFRTLPGLEGKKAAERLEALVDLWMSQHAPKPQVKPAAAEPPRESETQRQRRAIEAWFEQSHLYIPHPEVAKSRYWQKTLKENEALRAAGGVLNRNVHPRFTKELKRNLIPLLPTQLTAIASQPPERMVELVHLLLCGKHKDHIDALEARLQELRAANR